MQKPIGERANSTRLTYHIVSGDIEHGGSASAQIKSLLHHLDVSEPIARRAGIIAFEGEMNLIVYSDEGGTLTVEVWADAIDICLEDTGPGIEDLDLALTPGYSTAPEWATDLGFGAGMGLINMRKNADQFEIASRIGEGTRVYCRIDRGRNDEA